MSTRRRVFEIVLFVVGFIAFVYFLPTGARPAKGAAVTRPSQNAAVAETTVDALTVPREMSTSEQANLAPDAGGDALASALLVGPHAMAAGTAGDAALGATSRGAPSTVSDTGAAPASRSAPSPSGSPAPAPGPQPSPPPQPSPSPSPSPQPTTGGPGPSSSSGSGGGNGTSGGPGPSTTTTTTAKPSGSNGSGSTPGGSGH